MDLNRPSLKKRAISEIPLFELFSATEKESLSEVLMLKEFIKGTSIYVSDQPGRDVMFVADGSVDVKRSSTDGREVILSRLGVGDFFGEIALLTAATRSADVIAAEDCMVLVLGADEFERQLNANPKFARALLVHLANRVAAASTRIADLALLDVYCRVYTILRSLANSKDRSGALVIGRPTHKELAAMVGTSREMVTRALSKLEQDEVLVVEDQNIRILSELKQI